MLALEDEIHPGQRAKVETFDDQLFIILSIPKMVEGLVHDQ